MLKGEKKIEKNIASIRIRLPEVRRDVIERKALLRKIERGSSKKVMVLEAGAGNGKTTAICTF